MHLITCILHFFAEFETLPDHFICGLADFFSWTPFELGTVFQIFVEGLVQIAIMLDILIRLVP